jgi:hypothetical protein
MNRLDELAGVARAVQRRSNLMSRITALGLVHVDPSVTLFFGARTALGMDAISWL